MGAVIEFLILILLGGVIIGGGLKILDHLTHGAVFSAIKKDLQRLQPKATPVENMDYADQIRHIQQLAKARGVEPLVRGLLGALALLPEAALNTMNAREQFLIQRTLSTYLPELLKENTQSSEWETAFKDLEAGVMAILDAQDEQDETKLRAWKGFFAKRFPKDEKKHHNSSEN